MCGNVCVCVCVCVCVWLTLGAGDKLAAFLDEHEGSSAHMDAEAQRTMLLEAHESVEQLCAQLSQLQPMQDAVLAGSDAFVVTPQMTARLSAADVSSLALRNQAHSLYQRVSRVLALHAQLVDQVTSRLAAYAQVLAEAEQQ